MRVPPHIAARHRTLSRRVRKAYRAASDARWPRAAIAVVLAILLSLVAFVWALGAAL